MQRRTQLIFSPRAKNPAKNEVKNFLGHFGRGRPGCNLHLQSSPAPRPRNCQSSPAPRAPHAPNLHRRHTSNLHRRRGPPKYPIFTSATALHTRKFNLNNLLSRVRPSSHGMRGLGQELSLDRRSHFPRAGHMLRAVVGPRDRRDVARNTAM